MKKIGQFIEEINLLKKQAFIPNPNHQAQGAGGQQPTQAPAQGASQGGGDIAELLAQLPPEIQEQAAPYLEKIQQLPPDQQQAAIQDFMSQLSQLGGQGGGEGEQGPSNVQQVGMRTQGGKVEGTAPPTDLEQSTITLRIIDLLDLVSGGKATQSTLKVQDHVQKQQMRQQQAQQKQEQKAQEDAMQQAQQQQGMMAPGGIY